MHLVSGDLWAGAEQQVYGLCRAQAAVPGWRVRAIVCNRGALAERLAAAGIEVRLLDELVLSAPALLRAIHRCLRDWRPQVLHTHRYKENILGALAAKAAGVPLCLRTVHGDVEQSPGRWDWRRLRLWLDRWVGERLQQGCVAVSADLAQRLRAQGWWAPRVIENAIDVAAVREAAQAPTPAADAAAGAAIFLGRLAPVKRPDRVLALAAALPEQRFVLVGDGALREELQAQVRRDGLSNVHFAGFQERPAAWLGRARVLLLTSRHEGLPTAVLEAMALRVPVLAQAVGGVPEVLEQGAAGWLLPAGSEAAAAQAPLREILAGGAAVEARVERAAQRVVRAYDLPRQAAEYLSLYKDLSRF